MYNIKPAAKRKEEGLNTLAIETAINIIESILDDAVDHGKDNVTINTGSISFPALSFAEVKELIKLYEAEGYYVTKYYSADNGHLTFHFSWES